MDAIFPQFVRADYGPLGVQAMLMGLIIATTQIVIYGSFAWGRVACKPGCDATPKPRWRLTGVWACF